MKRFLITILLLALCRSDSMASDPNEFPWVLAKDKNGIKVYTRKVKGLDFLEFKGITTTKTSLSSLVALVSDANASPDWLANCHRCEVLKQITPQEIYTYSLSKAPWPVQDRDTVLHNRITQDKTTFTVTIQQTGKPDFIKEKKHIARVKRVQGLWQFTPQDNGYVEIKYQALSDPGGNLPVWLVNSSLASQPYDTLLKLQKVIKKEKYQNAILEYIQEPGPKEASDATTD